MSRMIDLIRASAVPATLMQTAARGALSVPAPEAIEILVHLAVHNKVFGMQARMTLAGWDENASKQAAANPHTPQEVLDYMIAGENLRPALLPLLLENPSVSDESLITLAASGTREVAEAMRKSPRVTATPEVLNALQSNSSLAANESAGVETLLVAEGSTPGGESPAGAATGNENPDAMLEEDLVVYLNANAKEIATEGEKPFQPIGGVYEDLSLDPDEPPAATPAAAATPATPSAPAAASPAAPKKAPVQRKSHLGGEEERASALQKISKLDIRGRIQLAMRGNKEERSLLIRDGTKVVALAVLESPKVSDSEVEKFASQKNVLEAVLRQIPLKRRFVKHYGIVRNLVFNPRTPLDISLGLMKNLLVHDLRNLSGNKEVSETVRKLATKMFKQKTDTTKRRMD